MVLWKICKNKCLSALGKPIGHLSAIGQPIWSYGCLGGRLVAPRKCKNSHVKVFCADRHIGIPRADWTSNNPLCLPVPDKPQARPQQVLWGPVIPFDLIYIYNVGLFRYLCIYRYDCCMCFLAFRCLRWNPATRRQLSTDGTGHRVTHTHPYECTHASLRCYWGSCNH